MNEFRLYGKINKVNNLVEFENEKAITFTLDVKTEKDKKTTFYIVAYNDKAKELAEKGKSEKVFIKNCEIEIPVADKCIAVYGTMQLSNYDKFRELYKYKEFSNITDISVIW